MYADMEISIHLVERFQFLSNFFMIKIDAKAYVYDINPAILAEDTREIKVYVSGHVNRTF